MEARSCGRWRTSSSRSVAKSLRRIRDAKSTMVSGIRDSSAAAVNAHFRCKLRFTSYKLFFSPVCAALWTVSICALAGQQTPVFRSTVELVAVDVQVVDREGLPITSLTADQFEVALDGKRRPVVSADLIRYSQSPARRPRYMMTSDAPLEAAATDRIFILAVDQASFRTGPARAAAIAARQFIDRLKADDLIGLY